MSKKIEEEREKDIKEIDLNLNLNLNKNTNLNLNPTSNDIEITEKNEKINNNKTNQSQKEGEIKLTIKNKNNIDNNDNSNLQKPLLEGNENTNHEVIDLKEIEFDKDKVKKENPEKEKDETLNENYYEDCKEYYEIIDKTYKNPGGYLCIKRALNPISNYNYYIKMCKFPFAKPKNEKLMLIPTFLILEILYDMHYYIIKNTLSLFLFLCGGLCKNLGNSTTRENVVTIVEKGEKKNESKNICNFFSVFLSIIYMALLIISLIFLGKYLIIPHVIFSLYLIFGLFIHIINICNSKQKRGFTDLMIYDNLIDNETLSHFIIIKSNEDLELFKDEKYYKDLRNLYLDRNRTEKSQIFIAFGNEFLALKRCLWWSLFYQVIYAGVLVGILYLFNKLGWISIKI
jgi:hypothetical protein